MNGFVSLVGAGPGDEELISLKGARRLEEADVLIYDRLVNPMLLTYTKAICERSMLVKSLINLVFLKKKLKKFWLQKLKKGKKLFA